MVISTEKREMIQYEKLAQGIYALSYKTNNSQMKYTKEQMFKYLESNDENKLREASNYFINVSGQYRRFIYYLANMFTFDYLVVPRLKDSKVLRSVRFD